MADEREYKIFISSPSDVWPERERLFRVIERIGGELGPVKLTPFRWEESYYSAAKTFQDQIPPPSQSNLVVCIFWKRIGSELPSQYRRPDGSAFAFEDSIRIAIKVLDRRKFLFEFQPTGLQFSPSDPARLKIRYLHADHDFDGDGRLTPADTAIQGKLDIWQRTPPDTLWTKLGALNVESLEELEGKIHHFTDHAIAW